MTNANVAKAEKRINMNIWLNPKYSKIMGVHAGKLLSLYRYGEPSTTIPEMGVHYKLLVVEIGCPYVWVEGEEIVFSRSEKKWSLE